MTPFLQQIAGVYRENHSQEELSDMMFVFPNRRAGLFFLHYLAKNNTRSFFSPQIVTINELFSQLSGLQSADRLGLLFRIYRIYLTLSKKEESFDRFAYWGEMLLSDFDDVDKHLVDARQLFTNVTDLKQIDSLFNYLSPNQIEAIRRFWSTFVPEAESAKQRDFRTTWEILYPLYNRLREELLQSGEGYEGMIFRDVVERMKKQEELTIDASRYVFTGFNALTPVEKSLFDYFKKSEKADFYWDYDIEELKDEANRGGNFRKENLRNFPSRFSVTEEKRSSRFIELVGIPSAVGQAKYVGEQLKSPLISPQEGEMPLTDRWIKTAVILPDENLLLPVLHSIPKEIETVNVTMGYPLALTAAATLIDQLLALQRNVRKKDEKELFYFRNVQFLLQHPYLLQLEQETVRPVLDSITQQNRIYIDKEEFAGNELLQLIFSAHTLPVEIAAYLVKIVKELMGRFQETSSHTSPPSSLLKEKWEQPQIHENEANKLELEYLYHAYLTLNRIYALLCLSEIEMTPDTFSRLVKQLLSSVSIPFEGEPLAGLQVMGLLETRGLDFENVIICSLNEGVFPQKQAAPSFIPYHLRKGFGLPTGEHQDAVFAYHFYRLIHRANRVICTYDTRTEGLQSGEVSRYIYQLKYHYGEPVDEKVAVFDAGLVQPQDIVVEKNNDILKKMERFCQAQSGKALSASAINTYIDCSLKFYLSVIEELRESDDVEESIEASAFGSIFHRAMEELYRPFEGRLVDADSLDAILKSPTHIGDAVALAFTRLFLHRNEGIVYPEGHYLLTTGIIHSYIVRLLTLDKQRAPFEYVASEHRFDAEWEMKKQNRSVNLKGFIDRIDRKEGITRIMDYKTGIVKKLQFNDLQELFEKQGKNRQKAIFQTFMYSLLYLQHHPDAIIEPNIIGLRSIYDDNFDGRIVQKIDRDFFAIDDFNAVKEEFNSLFTACLDDIFDPSIPFTQAENSDLCAYCPFTVICRR